MVTANLILIIAWPIAKLMHTSYLAAYLATSPSGSDSVAIIAMSLPVDRGFVMAMQIFRLFTVRATTLPLAMGLARLLPPELSEKPEKRA
ncbi:MAG: AbrB family transcriptional regulator [Acetobacteraceae bacterium]